MRIRDARVRVAAAELALELLPRRAVTGLPRASLLASAVIAQADDVADVRRAADRVFRSAAESGTTPGKLLQQLKTHLLERIVDDLRSGDDAIARTAGRAAASLHQRLDTSGGVYADLLPQIQEVLGAEECEASRSTCIGLAEIVRSQKGQKVLRDLSLVRHLREALCSIEPDLRKAAAACVAAAQGNDFMEDMLQDLCKTSMGPTPDQLMGLEALIYADGKTGTALSTLIAHASAPPHSGAQVMCLPAMVAAPAEALRAVILEAVGACVDAALAGNADAAGTAASAIAAGLNTACCSEAISVAASRLGVSQSGTCRQAIAHILRELLEAAQEPPSDPSCVLDALLPGALLGGEADDGAACGSALASLVRKCGAAPLVEEAIPRILRTMSDAQASKPLSQDSFEAAVAVVQSGIVGMPAHRKESVRDAALLFRQASPSQLQAHAMKSAGPLVRALVEKPVDVELQAGVVAALELLLVRAGTPLRPLAPALQSALLKLLEGPAELHAPAARTMGALAPIAPRADAIVKALGKAPRRAHLEALGAVLRALGPGRSAEVEREARAALEAAAAGEQSEEARGAAAQIEALLLG